MGQEVSDHIDERAPNALVVTPAYGYFPMLDFALPWLRARKARELQAQYSDALVRNPRARFCFVGHSNGTYMLGRSLIDLAGMRFHRVALAASVLPRDYQWTKCFTRGQVHHMTNHRASRDVPVGIVCNLLRSLGMRDVGTAGYHGFLGGRAEIKEVYYYDGGHSAAGRERQRQGARGVRTQRPHRVPVGTRDHAGRPVRLEAEREHHRGPGDIRRPLLHRARNDVGAVQCADAARVVAFAAGDHCLGVRGPRFRVLDEPLLLVS